MTDRESLWAFRSPDEIRATGAAWVSEEELAWLCDEAERLHRLLLLDSEPMRRDGGHLD